MPPTETRTIEVPKQTLGTARSISVPRKWVRKSSRSANMFESFFHAFNGIFLALKEERNLRVHFLALACTIAFGVFLKVSAFEWLALILSCGLVITVELVNTSLEHLVNISADGEYHRFARYAKDTAAAAVLCASFVALAVGLIVFLPKVALLIR